MIIFRILCRSWSSMPSFPHLYRWWTRWTRQVLFPLPQRHHLQPKLLHLWLVVQLRLCWGRRSLRSQRWDRRWTWCFSRWWGWGPYWLLWSRPRGRPRRRLLRLRRGCTHWRICRRRGRPHIRGRNRGSFRYLCRRRGRSSHRHSYLRRKWISWGSSLQRSSRPKRTSQ